MAQTIKLKRSATQGAAPTTSNLALGEVAINTYDGKMYIKKDVGGTESIVEIGGVGGNSVSYLEAGMIEYEYTATSNQTTFSGSDSNSATLSYTANSIMVFLNGVLQDDGVDYTATNGTSVVFGTALAADDEVRIIAIDTVASTTNLNNPTKLDAITTVNAQAAYSLTLNSSAYTPSSQNALIVSLNGITQEPGDSFTISGSTITFSPALVTGDVVDYIVDMGRAVTIGEYSGDLAVGGELEVTGDIIGDIRGATLFKAQAGESLAKGDVVHISGISGNTTVVSKADADDAAKMPAFGLVAAAASSGTPVDIYTFGTLSGLDTSSFSEGDELFVSTTAGTLTNSAPTGESSKLQKIAKVTRSDNSAGSVFIMGAGRSNAVPNLDDGDIFIGNASNQAVSASLNTKIEDYLDAGTSTPSFSTINSGNITTTGYIAGPSTFTIDPAAVGDNTGTLVVAGNLQVDGTTTTINSTTMTVDDLNITLASGAANAAAANGAGITVDGASATLTYNSTPDAWSFNKNVGIGNTSPNYILDVDVGAPASSDQVLGRFSSQNGVRDIGFVWDDSASTLGIATLTNHALTFHTNGNSNERMRIDSSGNVGIGATNPSVYGKLALLQTTNASTGGLAIVDSGSAQSAKLWCDGTNAYLSSGNTGADPLILNTGGGNVGIGTSSPGYALDVAGNIRATNSSGSSIIANRTSNPGSVELQYNGTQTAQFSALSGGGVATYVGSSPSEAMRIDSSGNVGIGTSSPDGSDWNASAKLLHIFQNDANGGLLKLESSNTTAVVSAGNSQFQIGTIEAQPFKFYTTATERMRIDANGNVGIGMTPISDRNLSIFDTTNAIISLHNNTSGSTTSDGFQLQLVSDDAYIVNYDAGGYMAFYTAPSGGSTTERMRISSSGALSINNTTAGEYLRVKGENGNQFGLDNDASTFTQASWYNNGTLKGAIWYDNSKAEFASYSATELTFYTGGNSVTAKATIDSSGNAFFYANGGELRFTGHSFYRPGAFGSGIHLSTNTVLPANENGSVSDNTEDLGNATYRWDDVYATNGTIQTSDVNEKQDIEALSEAETRVAVAAKGLLRKFRWKSAVEEKGDDARIHFGIIAQDLQAAFEAEGLDAGRYAMFIHSTWTDEETGEERSRMGVRYSELLAFIIAAI